MEEKHNNISFIHTQWRCPLPCFHCRYLLIHVLLISNFQYICTAEELINKKEMNTPFRYDKSYCFMCQVFCRHLIFVNMFKPHKTMECWHFPQIRKLRLDILLASDQERLRTQSAEENAFYTTPAYLSVRTQRKIQNSISIV